MQRNISLDEVDAFAVSTPSPFVSLVMFSTIRHHVRRSLVRCGIPLSLRLSALAAGLGALALACAAESPECRVGADCASGICTSQGICLADDDGSTSSVGGAGGSGGSSSSQGGSGGTTSSTTTGQGGGGLCSPNHDGIIERDEVPLQAGLSAKFEVASDVTFDTGGSSDGNGGFTWDMAQTFAGDHATLIETLPITGQWFESDFAGATYAARLSDGEDLLGVFEITNTQLLLRGVVSPEGGAFQTNLDYDPPVVVLSFPFQEGDNWNTETTVSGLALGVIAAYSESYTSSVDKHGTAQTPYGDFPVLRVHTELHRTQGLATLDRTQTHAFVSECFGTVATISSQSFESSTEFSDVGEVRRLAP